MKKPLWQPSKTLKENSLLRDFCRFINLKSTNNFKEIWQWTIDNPMNFGQSFGIIQKLLEIRDLK